MSKDKEGLTPSQMDEANATLEVMKKFIFPQTTEFVDYVVVQMAVAAITRDVGELIANVQSSLTTGALLYRQLLIKSGVDVVALEKNFTLDKVD